MNRAEAALVLAKVQAFDNRTVGETTIEAWAEALADTDFKYALAAVTKHYHEETTWMMPAHVTKIVSDYKFRVGVKLKEVGPPDFPPSLNWLEEKEYRVQYQSAILTGSTWDEATDHADRFIIAGSWGPMAPVWTAEREREITSYRATQRGQIAPAPRPKELQNFDGAA